MLRVAEQEQKSDTGRQRSANEDSLFARAPLFAVADGMGGARAGEIASKLAVEMLQDGMPAEGTAEERLASLVRQANQRIHSRSQADEREVGMGTTMTVAYVGDDEVVFAHVGDSRAYLVRDSELERLTHDHSLVDEMLRRGKITEEEAAEHPQRSVITRALGPEAAVEVDTFTVSARAGDMFLLCSDGLSSMIKEAEIAEILRDAGSLKDAARRLIDAANNAGGRDNITVVLFRLEEVAVPAGADQPTQAGSAAPSVAEVEEAAAAQEAAAGVSATSAPKRTVPLPPRAEAPPPKRRRGRRLLGPLVALVILGAIAAGAWTASRAVYFVATDKHGFVAIYRGLPYDGPAGVHLYERWYISGVPAVELPSNRRKSILDHRLRSQGDAADLVRKLELGQVGK
jgi:serine/threonine protein phosphatase PrpC